MLALGIQAPSLCTTSRAQHGKNKGASEQRAYSRTKRTLLSLKVCADIDMLLAKK